MLCSTQKIWDSGIGLSAFLVHLYENPGVPGSNPGRERLRDALFAEAPRTILDLGACIYYPHASILIPLKALVSEWRPSLFP